MASNGDQNDPKAEFPGDRTFTEDDSWLNLEIYVKANQPELLLGLDRWLQLNLISQAQVKKLARHKLSCVLPTTVEPSSLPEPRLETEPEVVETTVKPNAFTQFWRSFRDELSIRWLLFLGIFLVVVSSGVLAASQWQNFPLFAQYLVLLVYTLGFRIASWWTSRQQLNLTTQTLRAIATLLVPVNFWAMSHLGYGNWGQWLVIVAAIVLTGSVWISLGDRHHRRFKLLLLFLSYLHLGWHPVLIPWIIYGGIGIISGIYYRSAVVYSADLLFLLAAWASLLARRLAGAIALAPNYSLAIAIFAWLLATIYFRIERQEIRESNPIVNIFFSKIAQTATVILFCCTWITSILKGITASSWFFAQAVGISALAIHVFSQRLILYQRRRDLTAIFIIGVQALYIAKELIPVGIRERAISLAVAVSQTEYFPESIYGVTLFPYIMLWVAIASWLYRQRREPLAVFAEYLTLMLGLVLCCLSYPNPLWRSLNLLFSTLTLGYVTTIRQPIRIPAIYLTHLLGLITIINAIAVSLPNLARPFWGIILLVLLAIEWGVYQSPTKYRHRQAIYDSLRQSCWYFGLLLAALSYTCFLSEIKSPTIAFPWGIVWLVVPAMLTLIAYRIRSIRQRRLATALSCVGLVMAQVLWGQFETRLVGLAVGVWLMYFNAFKLRYLVVTALHLGFCLGLVASLLSTFVSDWNWLPVGAAAIFALYRLRQYLHHTANNPKFSYISQRRARGILGVGIEAQNFKLIEKYIIAADYWAIALIILELTILSIIYLNSIDRVYFSYLSTTALLAIAILWRYGKHPHNLTLYTLAWLAELLIAGLLTPFNNSLLLAIANIVLGVSTSIYLARLSPESRLNLAYIPPLYATLGILWRILYFNAYAGLLTLGAAFTLINIRVNSNDRLVNYLGLAGISLGIYELVIYQLQSISGGSVADGMTILALVAAAIAFIYRWTAWQYRDREQIFNLRLSGVVAIAHLHWAISSILKIIAAGMAIEGSPRLTPISIATSLCLGAYALIQGRSTSQANDGWVYIGIVEIVATLVYSRLIISKLSLLDPARIVFTCAIALLIYHLPWRNLGWRATPWRHTALVIPALMALVTAEDISYFNLFVTALFYLRIAFVQQVRWSYLSLGAINWAIVRFSWQNNLGFVGLGATLGWSILYIAQVDAYYQSHRSLRHLVRIIGSTIICLTAFIYDGGIIPAAISLSLIFIGLGLRIRAFLFTGTITLIAVVVYQLVILVLTYSFLKWAIGLVTGIFAIAIAAGFENPRDRALNRLKNYNRELQDWQ